MKINASQTPCSGDTVVKYQETVKTLVCIPDVTAHNDANRWKLRNPMTSNYFNLIL